MARIPPGALGAGFIILVLALWLHDGSAPSAQTGDSEASQGPSLAARMSELQTFTHKLVLSARAGNAEAVAFYTHEIEETSELIQEEFETYDGHAVRTLMAAMLDPVIDRLEEDPGNAAATVAPLIESCNACHGATEHGFIRIVERTDNPFLQEF